MGSTRMKLGSAVINIFDKERAIVDAFRFLAPETAIKAIAKAQNRAFNDLWKTLVLKLGLRFSKSR